MRLLSCLLSRFTAVCLMLILLLCSDKLSAQMQKLKIADNQRFLVREDGSPFVWIGDTNWFFAKLPPETIDAILDDRVSRGFTVMQVSCREKSYNGATTGPITQPNEAWWAYLDEYIAKCRKRGLYVGITLGWWGLIRNHQAEELYEYGKWVGRRYRDHNNIVWLTLGELGGHKRKNIFPREKIAALVSGIREGDSGNKLLTIHADYQRGTSISADAALCDFNNWQTSQWCCPEELPRADDRQWRVWEAISYDYQQLYNGRPKPTIDSEAWYEHNKDFCGATDFIIRRRAYFTVFAGAFGHTYGAGGLWDGLTSPEACSQSAEKAIDYPGAKSIQYVSRLLHDLQKDFLKLRPAQQLILSANPDHYDEHIQASLAADQRFALIYSASDAAYTIDLSLLKGKKFRGAWYQPGSGLYRPINKRFTSGRNPAFLVDPPGSSGPGNDWVLIIGKKSFYQRIMKSSKASGATK